MKKYYLCGPTVYNYPHIGNLRPTVTFDIMIRAQRFLGEEIFYLNNITDIDDKIIQKAINENKTEKEIAKKYEEYYLQLFDTFNLEKPTKIVRVTDSLQDIYDYISILLEKNAAYKVAGNVFFDVKQFEDVYGNISNQKINHLVSEDEKILGKKNPNDFTLWKETTNGIKFQSPFGLGRPGWHTECSCFIAKYFQGQTIDLHGGGIDLIFPHHENENIQHWAIYKKSITKKWIHFGTLNYKNQKMSKSIGNLIFPHDFLKKYDADTYKLLILTTNFAKPINLTDELLDSIQTIINKFNLLNNTIQLKKIENEIDERKVKEVIEEIANLNFSNAYKEIIQLTKKEDQYKTFLEIMKILGFIFPLKIISQEDKNLYNQWQALLKNKKYNQADAIREILKERKLV
ncbi:cysteine--tRNA ligase [Metamycoplasma alkalescens]|uniref:Cysteine--tRNA ligase n=1 Tax=Metamycoplasma alkalescens TaxID=45363 RepID=A0A318U4V9_9BACT|nr:cysteine--tRNA ligase [Metamycoplasma alkalescens]PYF42668.1 cysteinyl-tRNA synthetase [Metamycoplasma alkalescens]